MSMIFDSFVDRGTIASFIDAVHELDPSLDCLIFETVAASNDADPFPFELRPPIVHVPRTDDDTEALIELLAPVFGGRFAGT